MYLLQLLRFCTTVWICSFQSKGPAIVQTVQIICKEIFLQTYLYNILQIQLVNSGGNHSTRRQFRGRKSRRADGCCVIVVCGGTWQWLQDCTYNRGPPLEALLKFFVAVDSSVNIGTLCYTFYCRKHCGIENTPEK